MSFRRGTRRNYLLSAAKNLIYFASELCRRQFRSYKISPRTSSKWQPFFYHWLSARYNHVIISAAKDLEAALPPEKFRCVALKILRCAYNDMIVSCWLSTPFFSCHSRFFPGSPRWDTQDDKWRNSLSWSSLIHWKSAWNKLNKFDRPSAVFLIVDRLSLCSI